jgi:hypothetical protein
MTRTQPNSKPQARDPDKRIASKRVQCHSCAHWQTRGGTVTKKRWECVYLEDQNAPSRVLVALQGLLMQAGADGHCQTFEPMPQFADSYIAEDLDHPHPLLDTLSP